MADKNDTGPMLGGDPVLGGAPTGGKLKPLLLLCGGIIVIAAGAGYGAGMLLNSPKAAQATPAAAAPGTPADAEKAKPAAAPAAADAAGQAKPEYLYYDFEPIVVNLDEPRMARFVRVSITLAVRADQAPAAKALLDKKKPELKNWLTVFFASCTLEQVRGSANLNRLRREILDAFSQQLWPDQKPPVDHVLFKEFAVS